MAWFDNCFLFEAMTISFDKYTVLNGADATTQAETAVASNKQRLTCLITLSRLMLFMNLNAFTPPSNGRKSNVGFVTI